MLVLYQSLVVPFGGLHIAWNACLVQHFNGEEMSNNDFLSSFIIVCGLIFVVVFGSHEVSVILKICDTKYAVCNSFVMATRDTMAPVCPAVCTSMRIPPISKTF